MMVPPNIEVTVQIDGVDVVAGTLFTRASRGIESSTFRYSSTYLSRADAYELEPSLPLSESPSHTPLQKPLFNACEDSAPDRWGRMLMLRAERNRSDTDHSTPRQLLARDYLLGVSDFQRQGALRYRFEGTTNFLASDATGVPKLISLPGLLSAADAYANDSATASDIRDLVHAGGSLGGARPKAAVIDNDGRLSIAKFPKATEDESWDVIGWEKTALDLARHCGVDAVQGQLIAIGSRNALVVPRFDRIGDQRVGFVSALTVLEANDGEIGHGYLDIVEWLDRNSAAAAKDAHELWRRIIFTIAIGNTDDHLRNHGFLRTSAGWRLSPAFDLNPTPEPGPKFLSTAIGFDDTRADFEVALSVAGYFSLTPSAATTVLTDTLIGLRRWREVAHKNGLKNVDIEIMASALAQSTALLEALVGTSPRS